MPEAHEPKPPGSSWQLEIEAPFSVEPTAEPAPRPAAAKTRPASGTPPPLHRLIEAMLFIGGAPLTLAKANEVIRELSADQLAEAVEALNLAYRRQGRPYVVELRDHGYVLNLRPTYRFVHERLRGGVREARLSLAAIEVLSVVAYRQPVNKQEVDTLRGYESGSQLRQLIRRGLVAILDRETTGGVTCYGTTQRFLDLFGLTGLDDLPRTEDLQRL